MALSPFQGAPNMTLSPQIPRPVFDPPPTKLCVNCVHYSAGVNATPGDYTTKHQCMREVKQVISLVTGLPVKSGSPLECVSERHPLLTCPEIPCGPDGRFFMESRPVVVKMPEPGKSEPAKPEPVEEGAAIRYLSAQIGKHIREVMEAEQRPGGLLHKPKP